MEALFKGTNSKTRIRKDRAPLLVYTLIMSAASGIRLLAFNWNRCVTSLWLSFLISKMGRIIATISK